LLTTRKDLNPLGKLDKRVGVKYRGVVKSKSRIRITFSCSKVLRELKNKGLVREDSNGKFWPISFKPALSYDIQNIVKYLHSVFLGIGNYYSFCDN